MQGLPYEQAMMRRMRMYFVLIGLVLVVVWGLICHAWYDLSHDDVVNSLRVELAHHLEANESHLVGDLSQVTALMRALSSSRIIDSLLSNNLDIGARDNLRAVLSPVLSHVTEFRLLDTKGVERVRLTHFGSEGVRFVSSDGLVSRANSTCFKSTYDLPAGHIYLSPLSLASQVQHHDKLSLPLLRVAMPVNLRDNGSAKAQGLMVLFLSGKALYWQHASSPIAHHESLAFIEDGFVYRLRNGGVDVLPEDELPEVAPSIRQERNFQPAAWLPVDAGQQQLVWRFSDGLSEAWVDARMFGKKSEIWAVWFVGSLMMGTLLLGASISRHQSMRAEAERMSLLEKVRGLSQRLMLVHEDEQRSLARILHDEVGQTLTAVQMRLGGLAMDCEEGGCDAACRVRQEEGHIGQVVDALRGQLRLLRPPQLEALGLRGSLLGLFDEVRRQHSIEVVAEIDAAVDELEEAQALAIYRLVQEATSNILRHAAASSVNLHLGVKAGYVDLLLEDDGCGFEVVQKTTGFGLVGMRERVALLGGEMQLESESGSGTRLHLHIPAHLEDIG
jgi:two-component system sensor histidine kinase UhpB